MTWESRTPIKLNYLKFKKGIENCQEYYCVMSNFHIFLQPSNGQSNWNWGHGASSKWPFRSFWNIGQSFILLNNGINCIKFVRKKSLRLQRWQHTARQRFCVSYPPLEVDPSRSRVRRRGRGWWWLAYEPSIFEFSYFCNKSVCFLRHVL